MGQAQAQDLGLDGGPLYDPLGNYRRVANNWNDWASDPAHVPAATRTVSPQEMPPNPIVTPAIDPARQRSDAAGSIRRDTARRRRRPASATVDGPNAAELRKYCADCGVTSPRQ